MNNQEQYIALVHQERIAELEAELAAEKARAQNLRKTLEWVLWTCGGTCEENTYPRNTCMCLNHQRKIRRILACSEEKKPK